MDSIKTQTCANDSARCKLTSNNGEGQGNQNLGKRTKTTRQCIRLKESFSSTLLGGHLTPSVFLLQMST
jgi:hypothetical protein